MLVLSRKQGEKIFIGDSICITVVDIGRGKIKLGLEMPRDVAVYRQEIMTPEQLEARLKTIEENRLASHDPLREIKSSES